jgi:hypothetical protein
MTPQQWRFGIVAPDAARAAGGWLATHQSQYAY